MIWYYCLSPSSSLSLFSVGHTNGNRYTGLHAQWTNTKKIDGALSQARLEMDLRRQHVEKRDWNWNWKTSTRNRSTTKISISTTKRRTWKTGSNSGGWVDGSCKYGTMELWSLEVLLIDGLCLVLSSLDLLRFQQSLILHLSFVMGMSIFWLFSLFWGGGEWLACLLVSRYHCIL